MIFFHKYIKPYLPKNIYYYLATYKHLFDSFNVPPLVSLHSIKQLKNIENKFANKRCFIIGNGPSLKPEDLDLIKDEVSFASNRIFYIYDKTAWRPTFYCLQDLNILKETGEPCLSAINQAKRAFFRLISYKIIKDWNWNLSNITFVPIWEKYEKNGDVPFATSANPFIYDGWTVTYMAMQLAVHMGFTEIYLLGIDHSFPFRDNGHGKIEVIDKSVPAHFYESAKDNEGENAYNRRSNNNIIVTKAYESAEKVSCQTCKFRIYNATRGGKLEVFERVNLEDVLGKGEK